MDDILNPEDILPEVDENSLTDEMIEELSNNKGDDNNE